MSGSARCAGSGKRDAGFHQPRQYTPADPSRPRHLGDLGLVGLASLFQASRELPQARRFDLEALQARDDLVDLRLALGIIGSLRRTIVGHRPCLSQRQHA